MSCIGILRSTFFFALAAWLVLSANRVGAQDCVDDEELSPYVPGLVREDESLASTLFLSENECDPSMRLEWSGFLESDYDGDYRIGARFTGSLRIELNGKVVLESESDESKELLSEPMQLDYDFHQLRVQLKPKSGRIGLTVFWVGPNFRLEPIPESALFHERTDSIEGSVQRGKTLFRSLRCEACHQVEKHNARPLRSPSLRHATKYLRHDWLENLFVKSTDPSDVDPLLRMHRNFTRSETRHVIAWLDSLGAKNEVDASVDSLGDSKAGSELFHAIGCLACHQYDGVGNEGPFGGGDLTNAGQKRKKNFFAAWLRDPAKVNANHRMPEFELSDSQIANLSAFFIGEHEATSTEPRSGDVDTGRELATRHGCLKCHAESTSDSTANARSQLGSDTDWAKSCLNSNQDHDEQPDYSSLNGTDARAIERFVNKLGKGFVGKHESLLVENNCLGCHQRGPTQGLLPTLQKVVTKFPSMVDATAKLKPPALDSIGDKLRDNILERTIAGKERARRSWLSVQMPKFPLKRGEARELAHRFVEEDRVPDDLVVECYGKDSMSNVGHLASVGGRLVTADGFGCTSCHAIGKLAPSEKTPANQLGPNLSGIQSRLRKVWFDRWVRNPARITPKMEMPSVQIAMPNVLDSDLDAQLAAVWSALTQPRFSPPDPSPTRIVRQSDDTTNAVVLTDVLQLNGRKLIKPFLIGLPNRQNVLLDLETARLAAIWSGDTARQRTQGKTWFWEPPSIEIPESQSAPDMVLLRDAKPIAPQVQGQFLTEPDAWEKVAGGIELQHRLRFPSESASGRLVHVKQLIAPNGDAARRVVSIRGLKPDEAVGLRLDLEAKSSEEFERVKIDSGTYRIARADEAGEVRFTLDYRSTTATGSQVRERPIRITKSKTLVGMPGFRMQRLPLREDVMPISLAWTPKGQLVVGSLKGRVWLAKDTDGDGLEDVLDQLGDDLAAPYGLHAESKHIDVLNKFGVVRMHLDESNNVMRHETVASGWGHTEDYHDWVVGLPKDHAGNYYVSIPCQQDDRKKSAAKFRGSVLRLSPRTQTTDDPRLFELEQISAGHRFPMGIAMDREERIFVTDNQGNWNPYNELNHVRPGAHFGFINKVDRTDDYAPKLTPPAIDIPHPWTRSVNGICFLESPEGQSNSFGPFEGHLVGCEYDTRRLIRMTLEEVDGQIQGAAYPFAESSAATSKTKAESKAELAIESAAEGLQGPVNCHVAPDGSLYIANIRDSGWGGANNTGSIVHVTPDFDQLPPGILEVTTLSNGFRIRFTRPIDRERATDVGNYIVTSARRVSTPVYGGNDVDRRLEAVRTAKCNSDATVVDLTLEELREGFVYEFRLKDLSKDRTGFYPAEAYYTLRRQLREPDNSQNEE